MGHCLGGSLSRVWVSVQRELGGGLCPESHLCRPSQSEKWVVRILLECFLVLEIFLTFLDRSKLKEI